MDHRVYIAKQWPGVWPSPSRSKFDTRGTEKVSTHREVVLARQGNSPERITFAIQTSEFPSDFAELMPKPSRWRRKFYCKFEGKRDKVFAGKFSVKFPMNKGARHFPNEWNERRIFSQRWRFRLDEIWHSNTLPREGYSLSRRQTDTVLFHPPAMARGCFDPLRRMSPSLLFTPSKSFHKLPFQPGGGSRPICHPIRRWLYPRPFFLY